MVLPCIRHRRKMQPRRDSAQVIRIEQPWGVMDSDNVDGFAVRTIEDAIATLQQLAIGTSVVLRDVAAG